MFKLLLAAGVALTAASPVSSDSRDEDDLATNDVQITGILNTEDEIEDTDDSDEKFLKLV